MPDFNIRSDSVNVEEIMQQIRARIREKRGVDYTEQEIRELAEVKLETFLDPSKVRSELLEQYRLLRQGQDNPNAEQDAEALFGSPRPWLRRLRRLLLPILKLFVNPVPLMRAARLDTVRHAELFYELMHNLVVETTRLGIEVKNLKMRVESLSSRLDFDERRARALEGSVQYRPAAPAADAGAATGGRRDEDEQQERPNAAAAPFDSAQGAPSDSRKASGTAQESESVVSRARRRRRRRGRRGGPRIGGGDESTAGAPQERSQEHPDAAQARAEKQAPESSSPAAAPSQPREPDRAPEGDRGGEEPGT